MPPLWIKIPYHSSHHGVYWWSTFCLLSFHVFGLTLELISAWIIILVLISESISDINKQIVIDRVWMIGN